MLTEEKEVKKYIAGLLAVISALCAVTACDSDKNKNKESSAESSAVTVTTTAEVTTEPVSTYPENPVSYPKIEQKESGVLCEAESCELKNGLRIAYDYDVFSGDGYVTGFGSDGRTSLTFNADIPTNQHYDLSFSIASDTAAECEVLMGDSVIAEFTAKDGGEFTFITVYGIFLGKGKADITIRPKNGEISVDYLKITNSTALEKTDSKASETAVNENSARSAQDIMKFLTANYGKYVLTGQYAEDAENAEIELIYHTTGQKPVIRFSELDISDDGLDEDADAAAEWYKNGGIPFVSWFWKAPSDTKSSVYKKDTDFSLADAFTEWDIAELTQDEIRGLYNDGSITEECYRLILDIDSMAEKLSKLQEQGIPLMWRPIPEGSGGWYWWGADGAWVYKWLWTLMHDRMTKLFGLDNLIWVWNGQSADTMPDKSTFDIASADLYINDAKDYGSRFFESFAAVHKFVGDDKILGISECGSVPDIDSSFRDNAVWSFFGLWNGKYIDDGKGGYSEKFTSKDALIKAYNSEGSLTLDEYREMK